METDKEKQGGKRRQEEEKEDGSEACCLDVDAEAERCPKRARTELEVNVSTEHRDIISQLPELAQDKVFSFLGVRDKVQAAQVCPSWRNAVYRPCQWREVKVRLDVDKLSEEDVPSLQQRKIRHLQVDNFQVESNIVDKLQNHLVSLDLSVTPLPLSAVQQVFCQGTFSLRKLCVRFAKTEPPEFQGVQEVFQHLSDLEVLDLYLNKCNDDLVQAVGRNLKSLKQFSLTASDHAACNLEFLHHLSCLLSLFLRGVNLSGIDCLKSSCKTLKKASFTRCDFDTAEWPEVVSQMSSLEELTLSYCTPAVENALRQVTEGQKSLKVLKYLHFSFSPFTIDLESLAQMPNLEEFTVRRCRFESDDNYRALSCGLKKLRFLTVWDCFNVNAAFMKSTAGLPSLQKLCLGFLGDVDGASLEMIRNGSCKLRTLTLMNCPRIEGEDMKHVAGMSSLCDLTLLGLKLGSVGMKYLTQGNLRLETLHTDKCGSTFQDVKPWLEKQQSLHQLKLRAWEMTEAEKTEAQDLNKVLPYLTSVQFEQGL